MMNLCVNEWIYKANIIAPWQIELIDLLIKIKQFQDGILVKHSTTMERFINVFIWKLKQLHANSIAVLFLRDPLNTSI